MKKKLSLILEFFLVYRLSSFRNNFVYLIYLYEGTYELDWEWKFKIQEWKIFYILRYTVIHNWKTSQPAEVDKVPAEAMKSGEAQIEIIEWMFGHMKDGKNIQKRR